MLRVAAVWGQVLVRICYIYTIKYSNVYYDIYYISNIVMCIINYCSVNLYIYITLYI